MGRMDANYGRVVRWRKETKKDDGNKKREKKYFHFQLFFLRRQHVEPEKSIYRLPYNTVHLVLTPSSEGALQPIRNTGFILYKLQQGCRSTLVLIALSMHLKLEGSQLG